MTLDKAIKIMTEIIHYSNFPFMLDDKDAMQLGLEALKRLQALRKQSPESSSCQLPGETQ